MITSYDPKVLEPAMLALWTTQQTYQKAKQKGKGKKPFYFLDGPPYTSGKVHLGTAWNKSLKDLMLRFKRMSGFDVWDRAGYDMHGLPTENAVRKKLGIFHSKDIEAYGLDKYNTACEEYAVSMMKIMNDAFAKLGVWMDFENAYQSITKEFISAEWLLVKKAHEQKRLYEGLRTMPWCSTCQTNMAKHELEYKTVKEDSVFVKFKLKEQKGPHTEFLIIWTTTPWTLPFNLAVMVNPTLDYVRAEVGGEVWIMASALAGMLVQAVANKQMTVLDECKGTALAGLAYTHPFADTVADYAVLSKKHPKLHTVLLSEEYVDTSAGSGLVHCAPGCGPEDYEVGHRNNLPAWNVIDERGKFPSDWGEFSGLTAKKDDAKFVEALRSRGALIETTPVEHEYGHCQRCHEPVVFRTTMQWFFRVEDLKNKMITANKKVKWVPQAAFNAFESWLKNLRDNSITKQNFWGTPVPIWKCSSCGAVDVFGSVLELEKASGKTLDKLHRPWIDEIVLPCVCTGTKHRVKDVLDVWIDAGTAAWNCLDYPTRTDLFDNLFPADFILEGKDQIRGWFNLLMVASMLAFRKVPFKAVYMHGFVDDALGRKMSKSLGNQISPDEVVDQYGADAFRYYQIGSEVPGVDQMYNHEDVRTKYKNLLVLWNTHKFVLDAARDVHAVPALMARSLDLPEKFILSRLNTTIREVTKNFNAFALNEVPWLVEKFYFDLSRTYIQLVRDKLSLGNDKEKQVVLSVLIECTVKLLALLAPVCPFIAEQMYQNMREHFGLLTESVHVLDWPSVQKKFLNPELEQQVSVAQDLMETVLFAREKAKVNTRWPLPQVTLVTLDLTIHKAVTVLGELIKTQTNVKEVLVVDKFANVTETVHPNKAALGKAFGALAPAIEELLAKMSAEYILESLKNNSLRVNVKDQTVQLGSEHITRQRNIPVGLVEIESKRGLVYVNTVLTPELEAEGLAREIMRNVQQARKTAGLEKQHRIDLCIAVPANDHDGLKKWLPALQKKCGVGSFALTDAMKKKFQHEASADIRDRKVLIGFDVQ